MRNLTTPPTGRQVMLASPLVNPADTGGNWTVTVKCDESGWIDLSNGQLLVSQEAALANGRMDLSNLVNWKTFTRNGKDQLLRGTNGVSLNCFGKRQRNLAGYPSIYVETGTTFEITGTYNYAAAAAQAALGFPFIPDEQDYGEPDIDPGQWGVLEVPAASPLVNVVDATPTDLTITFSDDGVIDLSRLALKGQIEPLVNAFPADVAPITDLMTIVNCQLRKDRALMSGDKQGTTNIYFPARVFNLDRERNVVDLGRYRVKNGDKLVVSVYSWAGTNLKDCTVTVPMLLMDWTSKTAKTPVPAPCAPSCG